MNRAKVQRYKGNTELELKVGIGVGEARGECNWPGGDCLSGKGSRGGPDRRMGDRSASVKDHRLYVKW